MEGLGTTAASRLAAFAVSLPDERIPATVLDAASLHLLDALGCGLAARGLGLAGAGLRLAEAQGGAEEAACLDGRRVPAPAAALANGMLCHGLDFDDTHATSVCHITTVVGPAALAVAEAAGASGADLLAAVVAGSEVVARLGAAASGAFHRRGFHPTAVCGVFGAAAAAARLEGLDEVAAAGALGLAGSMASGLFAYLEDGTETKPVHAGWAAQAGVLAARLAGLGAEGPPSVLEARFGLYDAFVGGEAALERELGDLGERWETPRSAFKAYPACHYMHGALGAADRLLAQAAVDPSAIEDVVVGVPKAAVALVLEPAAPKLAPRTTYEAKFSLQYSLAALLVHGRVGVDSYAEAALHDERVLALARRVRYEVRPFATARSAFPGAVRLRLSDGSVRDASLDHQPGAPEAPLAAAEVGAKFRANAALVLSPEAAAQVERLVLGLAGEASVARLAGALGREPVAAAP